MRAFQELGEGIYRRRHEALDLNVGVVVTDEGVVVVDTRATPTQAKDLVAEIAILTDHPVRWVVNTHHHWDHTFGNEVFAGAILWGHRRCAEALDRIGESMREGMMDMVGDFEREAIEAINITPPDHLFDTRAALVAGGRRLELIHLGRAHTDNDVVVLVDDVVFAGDIIEEGAPPYFGDSFPLEWPATVRGMLALGAATFVPGHGDIVDTDFVETQAEQLEAVAELCRSYGGEPLDSLSGPFSAEVLATAVARVH